MAWRCTYAYIYATSLSVFPLHLWTGTVRSTALFERVVMIEPIREHRASAPACWDCILVSHAGGYPSQDAAWSIVMRRPSLWRGYGTRDIEEKPTGKIRNPPHGNHGYPLPRRDIAVFL